MPKRQVFKRFWQDWIGRVIKQVTLSSRLIFTFSLIMTINFPLYMLIWHYNTPGAFVGTGLRITATCCCLVLVFKQYWPKRLLKWLPLFWYGTLIYCLPFFFIYMTLQNHGSILWLMNTMSAVFFTLILLDFFGAMLILLTGALLAWFVFTLSGSPFEFQSGLVTPLGLFVTFLAAFIIGGIFTRIRGIAEDEKQKGIIEEAAIERTKFKAQKRFTHQANQVAHDIRSPLASLLMIVKSCNEIPERERVALREAANRINDIANNLLHQYQAKDSLEKMVSVQNEILVSALLLQFLTEKKYEYHNTPVQFSCEISPEGQFSFISIDSVALQRALSNLVNNAVDAMKEGTSIIVLQLDADVERVRISIQDDGKGISPEVIKKINQGIALTEGKSNGYGIGLSQVRETLANYGGILSIDSKIGTGTKMTLAFQRTRAPDWIAEKIQLTPDDIVVILDDDHSIHIAWDTRFQSILQQTETLTVKHFETHETTDQFISTLSIKERNHVILLTDYELVKQDLNGLAFIEKIKIQNGFLVTSHYANPDIQKQAMRLGTKIVPKQLASEIPIYLEQTKETTQQEELPTSTLTVDFILVDDDERYAQTLMITLLDDYKVDYFNSVETLKQNVSRYPKNTRIYLDNHFINEGVSGIDLAQELHVLGYSRLRLLTGNSFKPNELPDYLEAVLKTDIDKIATW